jgi:hypothetical protein
MFDRHGVRAWAYCGGYLPQGFRPYTTRGLADLNPSKTLDVEKKSIYYRNLSEMKHCAVVLFRKEFNQIC